MADAIPLLELPHRQARALLRTGAPVFLSIDPVEFHGPHLSLRNDHLVSTGLARRFHEGLVAAGPEGAAWPFLLASTLDAGVDPTQGPGSRAVAFRDLCTLIVTACEALADLGARRVVLMTFHGAPLHSIAIHRGTEALIARGVRAVAPLNLLLSDVATSSPEPFAPALAHVSEPERSEMLRTLRHDFHAGFMETSFALALAPSSVDTIHRTLPDCPSITPDLRLMALARAADRAGRSHVAAELRVAAYGVGWSKLRPFPGYTGKPRHATAEAGEVFVRYAVSRAVPLIRDVFVGRAPPPPPMPWMEALTFGGRMPGLDVPLEAVADLG
ncbi:MAG: creatininase family protein [Deltaproteobacteria bacterium]|nr:creatininase family protein [Deltaproteobacteria bacterium]